LIGRGRLPRADILQIESPMLANLTWVAVLSCSLAAPVRTQIDLQPPAERGFILDQAQLLTSYDQETIRAACDKLLTDKATPILVVTIDSISTYAEPGTRIETFAMLLFNQWQIGHAQLHGQDWNTGILLLVAKSDRKARIELGAGWGRTKDAEAQRIMNDLIIPRFKQGDYSTGIRDGVDGLDKMARGLALPKPPTPWWHYAVAAGCVALGIFTIVSLIRRGTSGWAWIFWAMLFAGVGWLLWTMAQSRRSSGGGFSGGSFGGGFSGGGGATGSW
jgi:uncharacterized protein